MPIRLVGPAVAMLLCVLASASSAEDAAPVRLGCPWVVRSEAVAAPETEAYGQSLFIRPTAMGPRYWVAYAGERTETVYFYAVKVEAVSSGQPAAMREIAGLPDEDIVKRAQALIVETPGTYQLAPPSGEGPVLLVASDRPVEAFERLGSRVFPDRPFEMCTSRGGTDLDGPLPPLRPALACLADPALAARTLCAITMPAR